MKVMKGDKVVVEYEGRIETGEVFDSSSHGDHSHPLEFEVGSGEVIKGFDQAILGMEIGDKKEVEIEPEEGYGCVNPSVIREFPRKVLPTDKEPEEGMTLKLKTSAGPSIPARITKVTKDSVTLDLNHPLAGKKLIFKIKLAKIN